MKKVIALLLTILFLSSFMALAQDSKAEAADQEIADSPAAEDIFSTLAALKSAETKTNPYGFMYMPAGSSSDIWIKKIEDDQLIVVTFTYADDGSVLTESMGVGTNISEMMLLRDYTSPKAVTANMTYSHVRISQTFVVTKLTDEQFLQYASDFLENPTDDYFLETLAAAKEIKMDAYSLKFPMQKGSKGDAVKFMQQRLNELGYLATKADGNFGKNTKAAVEKFQEANNLEVTGVLDFYGFIKLLDKQ